MVPLLPGKGFLLLVSFALTLSSCALLFPDRTAPKSSNYKIDPPAAPWSRLAVGRDPDAIESMKADLAFENSETGSIISLNSLCRKYTRSSLEALTNNLVRGIGNRKLLRQDERELNGSRALDTLFSGEVDKVYLHIRTVVLIKDDCTYDFIYVSIPKREGGSGHAFESFLASFRTE
jgi:hypothetical protein